MKGEQEPLTLLYPEDAIRRHFDRGADPRGSLALSSTTRTGLSSRSTPSPHLILWDEIACESDEVLLPRAQDLKRRLHRLVSSVKEAA